MMVTTCTYPIRVTGDRAAVASVDAAEEVPVHPGGGYDVGRRWAADTPARIKGDRDSQKLFEGEKIPVVGVLMSDVCVAD